MIKKYHRPENCLNIVAPKINSKIWNENLQVSHRMTDIYLGKIQLLNVSATYTVIEACEKVVSTIGEQKQGFNRELLTPSTLSIVQGSNVNPIYVIHCLGVKVQVKIMERNSKQGSFITFRSADNSKVKSISVGSISSIRFSFINLQLVRSFFKFQKKDW